MFEAFKKHSLNKHKSTKINNTNSSRLSSSPRQQLKSTYEEIDPIKVTKYFKRILERSTLESVDFGEGEKFLKISRDTLEAGALNATDTAQLFQFAENQKTETIDLVISVVTYSPKSLENHEALLLLAATLDKNGTLSCELKPGISPWIPSDRLTSRTVKNLEVMVGPLRNYGQYVIKQSKADIAVASSFADSLNTSEKLLEAVAGMPLLSFVTDMQTSGYTIEYKDCYVKPYQRISAVGALLNLYDFLIDNDFPPLYQHMIEIPRTIPEPEINLKNDQILPRFAKQACGSMSDGFPLTDSQRVALHGFLKGENGDVTAVSGPPGTGKTTLLQSIVANLVTSHALAEKNPPLVVGMSTNNQAVTNIIDSFSSVTKKDHGILDFRWLPKAENQSRENSSDDAKTEPIPGLAVYCPSQAKLKKAAEKYLVEQLDKSQTYTTYTSKDYLYQARSFFLTAAQKLFPGTTEISQLKKQIHEKLYDLDELRKRLILLMETGNLDRFAAEIGMLEADTVLRHFSKIKKLRECRNLTEIDQQLDITIRYAEFWLAVHYYEAAWLEEGGNGNFIPPEDLYKTTPNIMEKYWRQAAMLTPCFVMTCYQVPKYFKLFSRKGEKAQFDTERIDLLIVDESGQVDTPVGIPNFALAKRALTVGDENQLPPVWSIDTETDCEEAQAFGISSLQWENNLQKRGLTASEKSSLMRAASFASNFTYGDNLPGLFLSEHFRCHKQIINYCNRLLYHDLLVPSRPLKGYKLSGIEAPFQFKVVPGSHDRPKGSSRENQIEAEAIARWIIDNFAFFFDLYNTQEPEEDKKVSAENLIGVVTPFAAQAKTITKALKNLCFQSNSASKIPPDLWRKITIGTAHRLQGAERPVVLFSAVYGENSGGQSFIDNNPELMNVAVSRAKDLFIVFAAKNRWNNLGCTI